MFQRLHTMNVNGDKNPTLDPTDFSNGQKQSMIFFQNIFFCVIKESFMKLHESV